MTVLKTLTLYPTVGTFSVSSPFLAYAKRIISVHRSGTQYFLVEPSGPPGNYEFAFIGSSGDLVVDSNAPFVEGETVFVIYEPGEGGEVILTPPVEPPPPTVCNAPGVVSVVVNPDRSVTVTLPQMGYFVVRIVPAGGSCDATQVAGGSTGGNDSWTSPVLANGTYKACVLQQCPPSMVSAYTSSVPFEINSVPPPPNNFGARKIPADGLIEIVTVSGIPVTITSGAFPLNTPDEMLYGRHEAYSGVISVLVKVKANQQVVVALYRNGPLIQYKTAFRNTPGNVLVNFNPIAVLATDNIFVALDYT